MHCAVVIPCFCESKRLPLFLESLCSELLGASFQTSVVVVDDGSGYPEDEGLRKVIDRFKNSYPDLIADPVFLKQNSGKGGAVYAGWNETLRKCSPDLLCFVDADGAVPAAEVRRLISELLNDCEHQWDALFGSRIKLLGKTVRRLVRRHYTGRVFATFVSMITGLEIYDSQCGLKVLRRSAYQAVATQVKETRFAFDVELTLLLLKAGFAIREVPINWEEVPGSKVKIIRDSIRMFSGVMKIRKNFGRL